jgi:hypothetical protein
VRPFSGLAMPSVEYSLLSEVGAVVDFETPVINALTVLLWSSIGGSRVSELNLQ